MDAAQFRSEESILGRAGGAAGRAESADTLHDLALDQVFAALGRSAPDVSDAYATLLGSVADVEYRQAVFRALEDERVRRIVEDHLQAARECAHHDAISATSRYRYEAELWQVRAVVVYVGSVDALAAGLGQAVTASAVASEGWERLVRHVEAYRSSAAYVRLRGEALEIEQALDELRSNVLVRGPKVTVAQTDDETDLVEAVSTIFERFRQGEAVDHRTAFRPPSMDHVQAEILERVAQVQPAFFSRLERFAAATSAYHDAGLERFAADVTFYLAYLDRLAPLRAAGLPVCYPDVTAEGKDLTVTSAWDLALAPRVLAAGRAVVTNDLVLAGEERILVISGPNQGGKTTTARVFGQVHHLAALGCPVPGSAARIALCDAVYTVFEREERADSLEGRLGAEIDRLRAVFEVATPRSVIVLNEVFASTSWQDARVLTRDVLERISSLDALAVCVTFIDELTRLNEKTVSMVSAVDPDDSAVRTFRVERRPADGRAFARALAIRHELTREQIRKRIEAGPAETRRHGEGAEA